MGKFYSHNGDDHWYYYVYGSEGQKPPRGQLKNELASLICYEPIKGDVAVVRSGPGGSTYPEVFTTGELAKTLKYYKTHKTSQIFFERESSRNLNRFGFPKAPKGPGGPRIERILSVPGAGVTIGKAIY